MQSNTPATHIVTLRDSEKQNINYLLKAGSPAARLGVALRGTGSVPFAEDANLQNGPDDATVHTERRPGGGGSLW